MPQTVWRPWWSVYANKRNHGGFFTVPAPATQMCGSWSSGAVVRLFLPL